QRLLAAANNKHARAELGEMQRHRAPKAGASAGQKNGALVEKTRLEHDRPPFLKGRNIVEAPRGESRPQSKTGKGPGPSPSCVRLRCSSAAILLPPVLVLPFRAQPACA